jgi:hypothetical protein
VKVGIGLDSLRIGCNGGWGLSSMSTVADLLVS